MGEKQLYVHFELQTCTISHDKTWICPRKRYLKRETVSLLIATQKQQQTNAIRTYVKSRLTTK